MSIRRVYWCRSAKLQAVPPDVGPIDAGPVESNQYKEGVKNERDDDDNCEFMLLIPF